MRIILAAGGTGGSVTPILAVAQEIKRIKPETEFLFVGTAKGPEKIMVSDFGMPFTSIPAAKFRRYFSLKNLLDVPVFAAALFSAWKLVRKFKPDLVFGTGSFVQVPVCWVAKLYGIKIIIHQQDSIIGLANKMVSPAADLITTAFEKTAKEFYSGESPHSNWKRRVEWTGNPFRREILTESSIDSQYFDLHNELPVLLILGGASGAAQINEVVAKCLPELLKSHQVIHQTGKGKKIAFTHPDYHQYELIGFDKYVVALKMADIVLARAGLSTITELSALKKISIIVPMPKSHQEANGEILKQNSAAVVLNEQEFDPDNLVRVVNSLKFNPKRRELLSKNISNIMPHDGAERIAKLIIENYGK
jgi:UDP-N-acetylglucosamine--N-acetylmuramyl-(pentapeptide) pyrophosphoryl-undecaprenol N-acetylglucosamine transferase